MGIRTGRSDSQFTSAVVPPAGVCLPGAESRIRQEWPDAWLVFAPHITVCKTADAEEAEQVLVRLRGHRTQMAGKLPALTLGRVSNGKFEYLFEIALTGTKESP